MFYGKILGHFFFFYRDLCTGIDLYLMIWGEKEISLNDRKLNGFSGMNVTCKKKICGCFLIKKQICKITM